MRPALTQFAWRDGGFRRVGALLCLGLFLTLQLFAGSALLHKMIHADADSSGHHCVITLLSQGQVSAADVAPIVATFVASTFFLLPLISSAVLSSCDYRFALSRGPPRS